MQWYGDNSELNGIWNADLPDILLFGGIAIRKDAIPQLQQVITRNKRRYSEDPHFPIKYNFRDLSKWYKQQNLIKLYQRLLEDSRSWRKRMVEESLECDYKIIIACVNIFGKSADRIRQNKEMVTRFCFSNALMRVALLAGEYNTSTCDVILDWPEGNIHAPYTEEYRSAYVAGCCELFPQIPYYAGPLKELGFSESPFFTRMEDSSLLQFSDLVIGSTREFIDFCFDKKSEQAFGVQLTKSLVPKFRGYPHRIIGRGISVAPPDGLFRERLLQGMLKLRYGS